MEFFASVNWLAVVAATVVTFMAGWAWYGPLFGKPWLKLMGMTEKDITGPSTAMAKGAANNFMTNAVMAALLVMVAPTSMAGALTLGFLCWVGFTLYSEFGGVIWSNGNYPFKLMMINAGHQLMVALVGMAVLMYMG